MAENRTVSLKDEHLEAIEELRENRPGGFNLSAYLRKRLEDDFPEKFE